MCRSMAEGGARCKCQQGERRRAYQRGRDAKRKAQGRLGEAAAGRKTRGTATRSPKKTPSKAAPKTAHAPQQAPSGSVEAQVAQLRQERVSLQDAAAVASLSTRRRENPEAFMAAVDALGGNISEAARVRGAQKLEEKGLATPEQRLNSALNDRNVKAAVKGTYLDGSPEHAAAYAKALQSSDLGACRKALVPWAESGGLSHEAAEELAELTHAAPGSSDMKTRAQRIVEWQDRNPGHPPLASMKFASAWLRSSATVDQKVAAINREALLEELHAGTRPGDAKDIFLRHNGRQGGGSQRDRESREEWLNNAAALLPAETMDTVSGSFDKLWLRGPKAGNGAAGYVSTEKYTEREPMGAGLSFGRWNRETGRFSEVEVSYDNDRYGPDPELYPMEDADAVNRLVETYNRGKTADGKPVARGSKVSKVKVATVPVTSSDGKTTTDYLTVVAANQVTRPVEHSSTVLASNSQSTTNHELGHLVELSSPEIMDACNRLVTRRTEGITRSTPKHGHTGTDFLNTYSTVTYPSGATEVMSTGIEQVLGKPDTVDVDLAVMDHVRTTTGKVADDPEHRNLVLGLLSASVQRRRKMDAALRQR